MPLPRFWTGWASRVTLLAMSGGVPPALQFALRHPDRTDGLILLSLAPYAPLTAEEQALPVPLWLYDALFASDFPLWAMLRLSPRSLAPMFDARDDLTAQMTVAEATFLDAMIAAFLPVTLRRAGLANEGAAIDPQRRSILRPSLRPCWSSMPATTASRPSRRRSLPPRGHPRRRCWLATPAGICFWAIMKPCGRRSLHSSAVL